MSSASHIPKPSTQVAVKPAKLAAAAKGKASVFGALKTAARVLRRQGKDGPAVEQFYKQAARRQQQAEQRAREYESCQDYVGRNTDSMRQKLMAVNTWDQLQDIQARIEGHEWSHTERATKVSIPFLSPLLP